MRVATDKPVEGVQFSGNGETLLTWDDQCLQCWRAATGEATGPSIARPDGTVCWAISDDGTLLGVVSRTDRAVVVYDAATSYPRLTFRLEKTNFNGAITSRFSPDGRLLTVSDELYPGNVEVWDIPTAARLFRSQPHRGHISWIEFSDDATTLITRVPDTTAQGC